MPSQRDNILVLSILNANVKIARKDAVINKLRKLLVPGYENGIVTADQAKSVATHLVEYTPMWVNENPKYRGELVKLPIQPHTPMKPQQYPLPKRNSH